MANAIADAPLRAKAGRKSSAPSVVEIPPDDFKAGVDLAISLIRAGEEAYDGPEGDLLEGRRFLRGGRAQLRFATPYLQRLIDQPALLEGFSAVLTQELGTPGECLGSEFYRTMAPSEYLAGVPGEDGTVTNPEDQTRDEEPAPAITSGDVAKPVPLFRINARYTIAPDQDLADLANDLDILLKNAIATFEAGSEDLESVGWAGLHTLRMAFGVWEEIHTRAELHNETIGSAA